MKFHNSTILIILNQRYFYISATKRQSFGDSLPAERSHTNSSQGFEYLEQNCFERKHKEKSLSEEERKNV